MRQREMAKLYEVRMEIDPKTGKDVRVAYYKGKYFTVDAARKRRVTPVLWAAWALALAAFLTGGCTVNFGSRCPWVLPCYVCCMLPLFYLAMALWKVTRMGEVIDEVQKADGLASALHAGAGLAVLGALWVAGDAVFLFTGTYLSLGMELLFLLCGAVTAAAGCVTAALMKGLPAAEKK